MEVIAEQSDKTTHKHSPLDDLVLYCLDMLCPCDINFITNHMDTRWEAGSVEARLNSSQYWDTVARLKKVPVFLLELIMERAGHWVSRSLVLVTAKRVVALRCRQAACIHEFSIPQLKMPLCPAASHGLDTAHLCTFVAKNCKKEHLPVLSIQPSEMDQLLDEAKLNFRDFNLSENSKGDKPEVVSKPDTRDSTPIIVDAMGEIHMKPHHQQTLRNIVKAIGKSRWEDATQLLLQHHEHIVDFDAEDVEIYRRMAAYYRRHLDTDPQLGELSSREVESAALLHRVWAECLQGEALWQHVARHLSGRSGRQVRARLTRAPAGPGDVTLASSCAELGRRGHVLSLTIHPKSTAGLEVTARLQREVRCLVAGTQTEVFLLPCKYSALRCSHMGMQQEKFTYDPTRPAEQFLNFVRLTFANSLKKAGRVTSEHFHFSDIAYTGDDIHDIMTKIEQERFILPKDAFLRLNRRQMVAAAPSVVAPAPAEKRKIGDVDPASRGKGRPRGRPRKYV